MLLARDHHNLEDRRHEHQHQKEAEQRDVLAEPGIAQPIGDAVFKDRQQPHAHKPGERERDDGIADIWTRFFRLPRHEVVQALGHADLRQTIQRAVNQKELFVGAELRLVEMADEQHRDDERRGETDGAARDQEECGFGDRVGSSDFFHACRRSHRRAGGQRSWTWQLNTADENSPSASMEEPSHNNKRSIVSCGYFGSRCGHAV